MKINLNNEKKDQFFLKKTHIVLMTIFILIFFINISYCTPINSSNIFDGLKDLLNNPSFSSPTFSGRIIQIFLLMTVIGVAPTLLITFTSFVRISIVFSVIRTALGLQNSPPNQILNAIAICLTFFIMKPVAEKAYHEGLEPMISGKISEQQAIPKIIQPFKTFMIENTRKKDIDLFNGISQSQNNYPNSQNEEIPLHIVLSAFMISELHKAFILGFLIFLPFLIIDIVISSILMALGMIMLPPVMISLPIKLIFFVLIDGWHLLVSSLIKSFSI